MTPKSSDVPLGRFDRKPPCTRCGGSTRHGTSGLCRKCYARRMSEKRRGAGNYRKKVFRRDRGVCALCGFDCRPIDAAIFSAWKEERYDDMAALQLSMGMFGLQMTCWHADHITPICEGGHPSDLANLRTLCIACHRKETGDLARRKAARRKAASRREASR